MGGQQGWRFSWRPPELDSWGGGGMCVLDRYLRQAEGAWQRGQEEEEPHTFCSAVHTRTAQPAPPKSELLSQCSTINSYESCSIVIFVQLYRL